jgi:hypothetical protein
MTTGTWNSFRPSVEAKWARAHTVLRPGADWPVGSVNIEVPGAYFFVWRRIPRTAVPIIRAIPQSDSVTKGHQRQYLGAGR